MIMDPTSIRLFGIPGTVLLWIATLLAAGTFAWKAAGIVRRLGKSDRENRLDRPFRRVWIFILYVLGQKRLLNEKIGIAHFLFFWAFLFYAGTFWWALAKGLLPGLPVPYPDQIGFFATALDLFAGATLVALVISACRRVFFPPPHLHVSTDAYIILALIAAVMLTQALGNGFHTIAATTDHAGWTPTGQLFAGILGSALEPAAGRLAVSMWWAHMLVVLGFMAYLPFSKHMHLLFAPFNVFFADLRPKGDLASAGEDDDSMEGADNWERFTWRQLLSALSCAECGRCDRACPAVESGETMSPQQLVNGLKEHFLATGSGSPVQAEALWGCATCLACSDLCPVLNEHMPILIRMRRHLVAQGELDAALQDTLTSLTRYGNSFGKSPRMRSRWTRDLDFKIPDARKEKVDSLWFLGDYASFDPRLQAVTSATARLFRKAGLDFGILYEGEQNSGNDVRRVGEEGLFQMLRDKNLKALENSDYRRIVTTDPHTYNALKNEYGINGSNGTQVLHYTELIDDLLRKGDLVPSRSSARRVTYHDPCYLGRYNGIYQPPRRILKALGLELVEMKRNHDRSYCCSAGGGKIWMEDPPNIRERSAETRVLEAAALDGVDTLVVACPKDIAMFQDAVKTTGLEDSLAVSDIAELVWEAVEGEAIGVSGNA